MNQKLQDILNIIQQSEKLDAEQKENLLKAVKEADKEFEITAFKLERTEKVKKTTAILLEETIEELEQKRKAVEAQNRELEIEASLERVRAIALSMKESADMLEVCRTIANELGLLDVKEIRNVQTAIIYESKGTYLNYEYYAKHDKALITEVDFSIHHLQELFVNQMLNSTGELFSKTLKGKEVKDWYDHQKTTNQFADTFLETAKSLTYYWYSLGPVALGISTYYPMSDDEIILFKRFRNVFELAYRRFLDIEKALAQARESQIQLALERVRARTMAMHKSDELSDTSFVLFQQFVELGIVPNRFFIGTINEEETMLDVWITEWGGEKSSQNFNVNIEEPLQWKKVHKAWKANDKSLVVDLYGENLIRWNEYLEGIGFPVKNRKSVTRLVNTFAIFSNGFIAITTSEITSTETIQLLERFADVFNLTYRRFLDLQKAEAQAREAQIEAALERVRSRTMGMQKSEELKEVIQLVYEQFVHLKINVDHAGFVVDYTPKGDWHFWIADERDIPSKITHPYFESVWANQFNEAKEKGIDFFATNLNFEEKNKFYNELLSYVPELPQVSKDFYLSCPGLAATTVLFDNVSLYIENFSGTPYTDEMNKILLRFGKVFQQTYTRFLDLKKAEFQAREAQIEASLEKVRAVAMSMNKSEDLLSICEVSFKEFKKLGFENIRNALIHIQYDEQKYFMDYDFSDLTGGAITKIEYGSHPVVEEYLQQIRSAKDAFYQGVIKEDQLEEWKNFRRNSGQIDDPRLEEATALYYYFFSIGIGDIGISTLQPIDASQIKILKRFRNVFDLAYRRYNDITIAEEQARETQIQLALERVRARTMAMHKSEELSETSFVLFEQLKELGEIAEQISILIYNENEKIIELYATIYGNQWNETARLPLEESSVHKKIFKVWQERKKSLVVDLSGKDLDEFNNFKLKYSNQYKSESELPKKRWVVHNAFFSKGVLTFSTHEPRPVETIHLLERFAGVFDLTYTRFLDLKKAEAQAREAEIEAALERARSRTMAMQRSDELAETASHFFEQLNSLGIKPYRFNIAIVNQASEKCQLWSTSNEGKVIPLGPLIPLKEYKVFNQMYSGWKRQGGVSVIRVQGEDRIEWTKYIMKYVSFNEYKPENIDLEKLRNEPAIFSNFFFKQGFIVVHTIEEMNETDTRIIQRFVNVFEQTYTRFLDLQKAEEQAREAQIEAALERVRAKAMAMHSSNDLSDTMGVLFNELPKLGIASLRCGVVLLSRNSTEGIFYAAATTLESDSFTMIGSGDMKKHPVFTRQYESWLKNENCFITLSDEELQSYYKEIFARLSITYNPKEHKLKTEHGYYFAFSEGMFYAWSKEPYAEESINILNRFKAIIDLTFRRYLDLQKAEARAREAKIEASLERVRSKAMAMHNPNDLSETVNVFFKELKTLRIVPIRCGVGQMDEATRTTRLTTTTSSQQGDSFQVIGKVKQTGHPVMDGIFDHWKMQKEYHPILEGEDIKAYYNVMNPQIGYPEYPEGVTQFGNIFPFKEGFVFAWTENKLSEEELQIFRRFTSVLSLTYRRYIDLKAAEVRAFEAVRQASLDRIRAEIASMRTSEDLNHITPIIWRELKNLEVPFFRCGVYIVDELSEMVQVYLTTPDGKSLGVLNLSFDSNDITNNTVEHWQKKQVYKTHWDKEEFIKWTKSMMKLGQIQSAETYQGSTTPPESLYLHFVPFAQGMLYVGDIQPLADEKLELVKTLAEAFSIAYARYEDFKNLEEAKNKIEITLNELKSAQAQLVHSEKMASLGELTAGIAHEIKNPLNFVNNFSEVSRELLDEMKTEIENKNIDEVIELIEDLKQNLDKINQHGKRADSIVKGMLLHSRGTSGEKTLTDINDLLDQYVNLAYHGMRAQNKEFNITIEKDYDETLEKINVVPQDISRVFLNIINNACYASFDKKKKSENDFSPTLKVSTKRLNGKVEIRIGDNGNGIPKDIFDKIFQPFFTTKPTGEGTGLGLSLSYDIVTKVHNGELRVETKEHVGTDFIIILNN